MINEQVVWAHPRDVIIKLIEKPAPEQAIGFRVEHSKRSEFNKILSEYFYFCNSRNASVKIVNEITDAESKEDCSLTAEIHGLLNTIGPEFQRICNSLLQHSTRFR